MKRIEQHYLIRLLLKVALMVVVCGIHPPLRSQTIQFSIYVSSELNAAKQQDLDFGTTIQNQGAVQVNLGDPGMGVFSITGNEQFDVVVDLTAPANLTNDGGGPDVIPLILHMAYANQGANNINEAVVVSGATTRFPIKARSDGAPNPPPTPPHGNYTAPQATAYLYIYGSINVGAIAGGSYSGTVTLSVNYD